MTDATIARPVGGSSGDDSPDDVSPLLAIEERVQTRAKDSRLDLADHDGTSRLRRLITEEVSAWGDEYRRGVHPVDIADPEAATERAFRNLVGYGPLTRLLADDDVWEIMVNAPGEIFVRRHDGTSGYHDEVFHDDDHVMRTLTKILDDASTSHRKLDPSEGIQDAQLDDGARLHIVHGELTRNGHVLVNIRRFTGVRFNSLRTLVEHRTLPSSAAAFLVASVRAGASIVFSGAPGAGKTTMMSCCAAELDPAKRVVVAEEVLEADVPLANVASMQTRSARQDRDEIDLRRLVSAFLRMAPDVAIVGEVRDREALPLLLTLSSGVQGFTTIHASDANAALTRLRFICQLADGATEIPMSALNTLVSDSIDLVVHSVRDKAGPRVSEIVAVEQLAAGPEATRFTTTTLFSRGDGDRLEWSGHVPTRLTRLLDAHGSETTALLMAEEATGDWEEF